MWLRLGLVGPSGGMLAAGAVATRSPRPAGSSLTMIDFDVGVLLASRWSPGGSADWSRVVPAADHAACRSRRCGIA